MQAAESERYAAAYLPEAARYRPDIDGLRAIAVSAVVQFHAHVPGFGGGNLITQILTPGSGLRETLLRLYERRVPALAVAVFAVMTAGATLPPAS